MDEGAETVCEFCITRSIFQNPEINFLLTHLRSTG
jgi:hypothetical protein